MLEPQGTRVTMYHQPKEQARYRYFMQCRVSYRIFRWGEEVRVNLTIKYLEGSGACPPESF